MTSGTTRILCGSIVAIAIVVATTLFWENTPLLAFILLLLSMIMLKIDWHKEILVLYIISLIFGSVSEIVIINLGGAWAYTEPHLWKIPIWLPLLWGNAGVFVKYIYDSISGSQEKRVV